MSKDRDEYIDIQYDAIIHITPRGILLLFDDEEIWLPLSQCILDDDNIAESGAGTIEIKRWLVEEKGLEGYMV